MESSAAEVVLYITTLGAQRKEYDDSYRLKSLLDAKKITYDAIDLNMDMAIGDNILPHPLRFKTREDLAADGTLKRLNGLIPIPQVFIDGVFVGGLDEVQELEDAGYLTPIVSRQRCPYVDCATPRNPKIMTCSGCWRRFKLLKSKIQHLLDNTALAAANSVDGAVDQSRTDSQRTVTQEANLQPLTKCPFCHDPVKPNALKCLGCWKNLPQPPAADATVLHSGSSNDFAQLSGADIPVESEGGLCAVCKEPKVAGRKKCTNCWSNY
eukprot:GILK01010402.1.p1 GENE.GILK01010402.1~~GILK01010402.1.p1  ORF type:complete len:267 (-),score=27.10 GILK01010402.1:31-831(-)